MLCFSDLEVFRLLIFPGAKVLEIVHLSELCIVQGGKVALSSEDIWHVFGLATVYVKTNPGAALQLALAVIGLYPSHLKSMQYRRQRLCQ